MTTGLEAVGAASAVVQLISFAGKLVSLTLQIYDGRTTPENELGEYAGKVSDAASRVQIRAKQVSQVTPEEKKLFQVAQECVAAAEGLSMEAKRITKGHQKGKVLKAVIGAFRANYNKRKMQDLDLSLKRCKGIMETELLHKICSTSDAVKQQHSQSFQKLDRDVQTLITQIASGNVKIEDLLVQESRVTRDIIITSLTSEFKALDVRTVAEAQRQRLLKSLKSEEIRQRYNNVMSPSDACFERVIASYERVCSQEPKHKASPDINDNLMPDEFEQLLEEEVDEIDKSWDTFCSWLRSNTDIFWVQGKPGSGKSTLMKFIMNNDNTKSLLNSWNQDARILSHFFWKIGSESQNSIKGLLCSLLHDILSNDNVAKEWVLRQFAFSQSKDYYKEWSIEEVDKVLFSLLHISSRSTCIFIDGLDEISDGDGVRALMNIIKRLLSCSNVKLCTSSRPEVEIVSIFETMGVPSLRLEDLTRPEMAVYISNKLDLFQGQLPALVFERFKTMLIQKASGVFLWLFLATNSLTKGIENCDDENVLFDRLKELPGELEDLYEAMWLRLGNNNRVYRYTAAKYFNCLIYGGWDRGITLKGHNLFWSPNISPTLGHLSLVTKTKSQILFPSKPRMEDVKWLRTLCDKTTDDIKTRCAGMLEIGSHSIDIDVDDETHFPSEILPLTRSVEFIHRTAYDFLVDTESGQAILGYRTDAQALLDLHIELAQSWLYLVSLYSQSKAGFVQDFYVVVSLCVALEDEGASRITILSILSTVQDLYEAGALDIGIRFAFFCLPLEIIFGFHFASFEEDFLLYCARPDTTDIMTTFLQGIAVEDEHDRERGTPVKLIQKMIDRGGDPHAIGTPPVVRNDHEQGPFIAKQTTAFALFLQTALAQDCSSDERELSKALLDTIVSMSQTCQDWHQKILIAYNWGISINRFTILSFWNELWYFNLQMLEQTVVFEVDMRFLLSELMHALHDRGLPTYIGKLHGIVGSFTGTHVHIRHIGITRQSKEEAFCYRILAQKPFENIVRNLFYSQSATTVMSFFEVIEFMDSFGSLDGIGDASDSRLKSFGGSLVKVPFAEELDSLVDEGLLSRMS